MIETFKKGDCVFFLKRGVNLLLNRKLTRLPFNRVVDGIVISCNPDGYTRVRRNGEDYYILTPFVYSSFEELEKEAKRLNKGTLSDLKEFLDNVEKDYL
jgi:hypothetical protein